MTCAPQQIFAVSRIVARHEQKIADTEQAAAEQVGLNGDPVTVRAVICAPLK
jgi:hypothetical protein